MRHLPDREDWINARDIRLQLERAARGEAVTVDSGAATLTTTAPGIMIERHPPSREQEVSEEVR